MAKGQHIVVVFPFFPIPVQGLMLREGANIVIVFSLFPIPSGMERSVETGTTHLRLHPVRMHP